MKTRRGVMFVASSTKIGGGTRVLMDLMVRLAPRYQPFLVAPGPGPVESWAREAGIPCTIVRSSPGGQGSGRISTVRYAAALVPLIISQGIAILHAEGPICYRPVGLAGRLTGRSRICHLGFPPSAGELSWNFRFGPDLVIACYEGQMRDVAPDLARVRPESTIVAIPNGIDLQRFRPRRQDDENELQQWRFGARHMVLIIGHLSDVKGYPTLLRAAARVLATVPDCAFVAVGGETIQHGFKAELQRLAGELGILERLHFAGWQSDVAPLLRAADVLALPSLEEGLPLAVLEAMASGVPVVATPVGGVPDAVIDQVTGLLVPPGDAIRLSEALVQVLTDADLANRLGCAARQRAEEHFSLDRHLDTTIAAYDRLLGCA